MKKVIISVLIIFNIILLFLNIYMIYLISKPSHIDDCYTDFERLEKLAFNTPFVEKEGYQEGKTVIELIDRVMDINKQSIIDDTKDNKFINMIFKNVKINVENIEEIVDLKNDIDENKIYIVILSYNKVGLINLLEIKENL